MAGGWLLHKGQRAVQRNNPGRAGKVRAEGYRRGAKRLPSSQQTVRQKGRRQCSDGRNENNARKSQQAEPSAGRGQELCIAQAQSFGAPQLSEGRSEEHTSELQSPCNLVC